MNTNKHEFENPPRPAVKWRTKRIEDVKEPVVGRFYLVPRVWAAAFKCWWPVIGPWHEDADLGVEEEHFHYDARFLSEWQFGTRVNEKGRFLARVHTQRTTMGWDDFHAVVPNGPPAVEYGRMKMKRVMPEFPFSPFFAEKIERPFLETRLVCRVCPHRGMSLEGLPVDAEGRVVCNGHGLRWNLKTGRLCPRGEHGVKGGEADRNVRDTADRTVCATPEGCDE